MMSTDREIWFLFSSSQFVGDVLRQTTRLEFDLDTVLAQYFIRSDRYEAAMEFLIPEISFGRKIDLFSNLQIRKSLLSYRRSIAGLRKFQKIRNIIAHSPHVSFTKAKKLARDGNYRKMLHGFPDGMLEESNGTARSLSRLLRVREFRNPFSADAIDAIDFSLRLWMG